MIIEPDSDAIPIDFPVEAIAREGVASLTYLIETPSTNSFALARLTRGIDSTPWLVLAQTQTAGRGRGENRWWSESGSLTFSLVVDSERMRLPQSLWPRLSMAVGLAICQLLERSPWRLPMQIKWPNDIYVHGKKLGGILIEHSGPFLVIGVGLNVNQRFEAAPEEVRAKATSLLLELRSECHAWMLLSDVLKEILTILPRIGADEIDFAYEAGERNYLQWKNVRIRQGNLVKEGVCVGIDFDGALLLNWSDRQERVLSGTIEMI